MDFYINKKIIYEYLSGFIKAVLAHYSTNHVQLKPDPKAVCQQTYSLND
jgi:hypothetical protein